jgi:sorting nexin-25
MVLDRKNESIEPLGRLLSRSVEDLRDNHPRRPALSSVSSSRMASASSARKVPLVSDETEVGRKDKHLFDDEPAKEDGNVLEDEEENGVQGILQHDLPSDVDIAGAIARLQDKIEGLVKQEHLLDGLIRQAELTGNSSELSILNRSHTSVRREQRTSIFQKAQYEQQEEENRIVPGRTVITIPSAVITVAEDEGGKQVVRYTIEVRQGGEGQTAGWKIARRYNDFWELDRSLREWANTKSQSALMKGVDELPPKKLVPNLSASFIETRRSGLQRYLQVGLEANES